MEMAEEFDLFTIDSATLEEQRLFEQWWHRQTGRRAIVLSGVTYHTTLEYGDGK